MPQSRESSTASGERATWSDVQVELIQSYTRCPDCGDELQFGPPSRSFPVLLCESCSVAFPIIDGIPVLLSSDTRSESLERTHMEQARSECTPEDTALKLAVENTLAAIQANRENTSWAWEDEAFWKQEYQAARLESGAARKKWTDRGVQRIPAIECAVRTLPRPKSILDIGCGDGFNFRELIRPLVPLDTAYIAADISIDALRLSRDLCPHSKALFVVCSADHPPFAQEAFGLVTLFGILHHTQNAADNIVAFNRLIAPDGVLLLHEALERPSLRPSWLRANREESAHEHRIRAIDVDRNVSTARLRVAYKRAMHSPLLGGSVSVAGPLLLRSKRAFSAILTLDGLAIATLGRVMASFRAGEVLIVAQKSSASR